MTIVVVIVVAAAAAAALTGLMPDNIGISCPRRKQGIPGVGKCPFNLGRMPHNYYGLYVHLALLVRGTVNLEIIAAFVVFVLFMCCTLDARIHKVLHIRDKQSYCILYKF